MIKEKEEVIQNKFKYKPFSDYLVPHDVLWKKFKKLKLNSTFPSYVSPIFYLNYVLENNSLLLQMKNKYNIFYHRINIYLSWSKQNLILDVALQKIYF